MSFEVDSRHLLLPGVESIEEEMDIVSETLRPKDGRESARLMTLSLSDTSFEMLSVRISLERVRVRMDVVMDSIVVLIFLISSRAASRAICLRRH